MRMKFGSLENGYGGLKTIMVPLGGLVHHKLPPAHVGTILDRSGCVKVSKLPRGIEQSLSDEFVRC